MSDVDEARGSDSSRRRSSREDRRRRRRAQRKPLPLWAETLLLLVLAVVLAVGIKALFLQAFYIPSPSMEPQFVENDRIIVQKVSYWGGGAPERGDIVVFQDPGGWLDPAESAGPTGAAGQVLESIGLYPTGGHLVKRVMATGGDHIVCCDADGRITINGEAIDESAYLPAGTAPSDVTFDKTVPEGFMWMMGDNRAFSFDSRGHMGGPGGGFVDQDLVVGKVFTLIWPWSRIGLVERPEVFDTVPDPQPGSAAPAS